MTDSRWLRKPDDIPDAVLIRGPVGVGKSATADDMHEVLKRADVAHAALDLDWLAAGWPQYGQWNNEQLARNLAAVSASYRAAGAKYFILAGVAESADEVANLRASVGATTLVVCGLTAPLSVIEARLQCRNQGERLRWHVNRAAELVEQFAGDGLDDLIVDANQPALRVAEALARLLGWID